MNRFLSEADRLLGSFDGDPVALQRVARAAIPRFADFCLIFLVENSHLRCVASAHRATEGDRLLRELTRVYKITPSDPVSTVAHVVRTGRPKLRTTIVTEPHASSSEPRVFALHQRLGARSALVVPIGSAPAVRGAISFSYAGSGRRYTPQDVPIAQRVGSLIAAYLHKRIPTAARRPLRLRARV